MGRPVSIVLLIGRVTTPERSLSGAGRLGWGGGNGDVRGEYRIGRRTRSARESSSWPIMLDFLRHRATLPSIKSKKRANGRKVKAE